VSVQMFLKKCKKTKNFTLLVLSFFAATDFFFSSVFFFYYINFLLYTKHKTRPTPTLFIGRRPLCGYLHLYL
jgi:hypothetical protein